MWRHELFSDPSQETDPGDHGVFVAFMAGLCGQLGYLMIFRSEHYSTMADDLHERERTIKAARGEIVDRNRHGHRLQPDGLYGLPWSITRWRSRRR